MDFPLLTEGLVALTIIAAVVVTFAYLYGKEKF